MLVDYWAHRHADDPKLQEPMETEDFDKELAAMEAAWDARAAEAAVTPEEDWVAEESDGFEGAA